MLTAVRYSLIKIWNDIVFLLWLWKPFYRCPECGGKLEFEYKDEDDIDIYYCTKCNERFY